MIYIHDVPKRRYPEQAAHWRRELTEAEVRHFGGVIRKDYVLPARKEAGKGKKLGFISDIHYRGRSSETLLADALSAMEDFAPDVLLLGGDLIGDCSELEDMPEILKEIRRRFPVLCGVLGNHERSKKWIKSDYWENIYRICQVPLLTDQGMEFDGIYVYGKSDPDESEALKKINFPEDTENILLTHNPDTVIALEKPGSLEKVTLAFTGHTHGGQLRLPGVGAVLSASVYGRRFDCGLFTLEKKSGGRMEMIISAGLGKLTFPVRFRCPPEVAAVTLV